MVGPATVGSYQFEIRIERTRQLRLFDTHPRVSPDKVAEAFFRILNSAGSDDAEAFRTYVPDRHYQSWFLRMVRNIAPTGKALDEIEIARIGAREAVVLRPAVRHAIQRTLQLPDRPKSRDNVKYGVLRALDLDHGFLVLVEGGQQQRCRIRPNRIFDDVVGPFVNHRVRVTGAWSGRWFYADDITESDESGEAIQDDIQQRTVSA